MDSVYSINIERAVLSSILFNPEELEDVLGVLKPKDFYLPAHQKIFEVMVNLHNSDMPIDEEFISKGRVNDKEKFHYNHWGGRDLAKWEEDEAH